MTVPVNKRKESKLEVLVKTEKLMRHTINCTTSKVFVESSFGYPLSIEMQELSIAIHISCCDANNIRVVDRETAIERRNLQKHAFNCCKKLISRLTTSHTLFHLRGRKVKYWLGLITDAMNLIKKWKDNDSIRYKKYYTDNN
jgi:hypothetical protein